MAPEYTATFADGYTVSRRSSAHVSVAWLVRLHDETSANRFMTSATGLAGGTMAALVAANKAARHELALYRRAYNKRARLTIQTAPAVVTQ